MQALPLPAPTLGPVPTLPPPSVPGQFQQIREEHRGKSTAEALEAIGKRLGCRLFLSPTVPDRELTVSTRGLGLRELMTRTRDAWTKGGWEYGWAGRVGLHDRRPAFALWRRPADEKLRAKWARQESRKRLLRLRERPGESPAEVLLTGSPTVPLHQALEGKAAAVSLAALGQAGRKAVRELARGGAGFLRVLGGGRYEQLNDPGNPRWVVYQPGAVWYDPSLIDVRAYITSSAARERAIKQLDGGANVSLTIRKEDQ